MSLAAPEGCGWSRFKSFEKGANMPFSPKQFAPIAVECPFLDQPCVQGPVQGFHCRLRAAKPSETEPLIRFLNDAVVFCEVCQKEIVVSAIPRVTVRQAKS
jgi:hypothetical protein